MPPAPLAPRLVLAARLLAPALVATALHLPALAHADAAPLSLPPFDPDQRVFVIPSGYVPPAIGPYGLARLDDNLRRLHFPFYVILRARLPPGPGSDDERAQAITDGAAEAWTREGADPSVSTFFALTFEPRKYSLLVGSRWKVELGLEGAALDPLLERFLVHVRGTPQDPVSGIIDLARALDDHAFDQTDPERIAARRLAGARGHLRALHRDLRDLLDAPSEHLPWEIDRFIALEERLRDLQSADDDAVAALDLRPFELDVAVLRDHVAAAREREQAEAARRARLRARLEDHAQNARRALAHGHLPDLGDDPVIAAVRDALPAAEAALAATDPDAQSAALERLEPPLSRLLLALRVAQEAAAERRQRALLTALAALLALSLLGGLLVWLRDRRRRALLDLEWDADAWEDKLANAGARFVELYGERDAVLGLLEHSGRTAELRDAVTREIDALYAVIRAMEAHVQRCRARGRGAWISLAAIDAARAALTQPFEADTGELNQRDLFAPLTRRLTVDPARLQDDLDARFKATLTGWERLRDAAARQLRPATELFPHARLDALLADLDAAGLPHRWIADHPLIGDDAADAAVYEAADALRWVDPVAYAERIDALLAAEAAIAARVDRLMDARRRALAARDAVPDLPAPADGLRLDPADDPALALARARAALQRLDALLAAPPAPPDDAQVLAAADEAQAAFAVVSDQILAVQLAAADTADLVAAAPRALDDAERNRDDAAAAAADARRYHVDVEVDGWLTAARDALHRGHHDLDEARRALAERRLVAARRAARAALDRAAEASREAARARAQVRALEDLRARYEEQVRRLPQTRAARNANLQLYGAAPDLPEPALPAVTGPARYADLNRDLDAVLDAWQERVRQAHFRHLDAQKRAHELAEQEALRKQVALARRSSGASWSSGSSSRGSSWSSSGSSSRAGSWSSSSRSSSRAGSW